MTAQAPTVASQSRVFSEEAVRNRLREELQAVADDGGVLHPGWEPVLDSLTVVTVVTRLEPMLGVELPPDKVIQRGGYRSVDEAVDDMTGRIKGVWAKLRRLGRG